MSIQVRILAQRKKDAGNTNKQNHSENFDSNIFINEKRDR